MGNANPRYLRAWPDEQLNAGGAAIVYGTAADLAAGVDAVKLYNAATLAGASVKVFGSIADDGKFVKVTSTGKIDLSLLPLTSALVYRGTEQPASAAPVAPAVGDVYLLDAAGTFGASWGVLSGQSGVVGDQLIYDGTKWNLIAADDTGVSSVTAGNGLTGGTITNTGTISINYGTSADLIAGTDTVKLYNAATLAGASTTASAGAGDAGKFVKLDPTGKIDASMLPPSGGTGTVTNVTTGTGLTGGPITTTGTISLAPSGATAGTYKSVTVDAYGRVTAGTNPTTLAGYGITDGVPNTATVSGGTSLAGGGALSAAPLVITLVNDAAAPGAAKYYGTDGAGVKGWQTFPAAGGTGTVTSIATGTGLTGGPITTTGTISLAASGVTAGTAGSATQVPVFTVDTYGRITGYTNTTITPAWTSVTGKPTTLAGYGITDAVPNTATVSGTVSLTGGGALSGTPLSISLVNDVAAPGNSFYYGTNASGVKGFHALPAGGGGTGDVVGPALAADNGVARYDGITGKLIQGSGVFIDDLNNVTGVVNLTTTGSTILGDAAADTYTFNGSTMAVPNNLNIDSNTLMIDAANNRVGFGTATPLARVDVSGTIAQNAVAVAGSSMDLSIGQVFTKTTAGAAAWSFANVPAGRYVETTLFLTNGGSAAQTWPASVTWIGGAAPSLKASGVDVVRFWTNNGGTNWYAAVESEGSGNVVGPASSTDNAIARYDGTTGKLIQNSSVIVTDTGVLQAGAGAVATPTYSAVSDPNTGVFFPAADSIGLSTGGTESGRIASTGFYLFALDGDPAASNVGGFTIGAAAGGTYLSMTRDGGNVASFNRKTNDGNIVEFRQDGVIEGTVAIAGTVVSYNAFSGAHWSQLSDNSRPDILRGTVVETIDEKCVWPGEENDQLAKFKVSDTAASPRVYGVFMAWDNDETTTNDAYITGLGAFLVRIDAGVVVSGGDLLESAGNGCARVQSDGAIKSSTIGKVTSSVKTDVYDDGSYTVPCVLYCG